VRRFTIQGIDADYLGYQDINKDGKGDDTQINSFVAYELSTEVHKIGLQMHTLYF
jgi:hypothetical protein